LTPCTVGKQAIKEEPVTPEAEAGQISEESGDGYHEVSGSRIKQVIGDGSQFDLIVLDDDG
jgi:hypothetical protein